MRDMKAHRHPITAEDTQYSRTMYMYLDYDSCEVYSGYMSNNAG